MTREALDRDGIRNAINSVSDSIDDNKCARRLSQELLGTGPANTLIDRIEGNIKGLVFLQAGLLVASGELDLDEALQVLQVPEASFEDHGFKAAEDWNGLQDKIKISKSILGGTR